MPFLYGQMEKIGTIEALDVTKPPGPLAFPYRKNGTSTSVMYWDSDIAKWIETASYTLATHPDPALEAPDRRRGGAHRQGAGAGRLLQQLLPAPRARQEVDQPARLARALLPRPHDRGGGRPQPGDRQDQPARHRAPAGRSRRKAVRAQGGPEARLLRPRGDRAGAGQALPADRRAAATSSWRATSSTSAAVSRTISTSRPARAAPIRRTTGTRPTSTTRAHVPVREQDRVVGHAVRAMYLYCAMADLAAETGDAALLAACRRLWADLNDKRLYVTGGLGPSARTTRASPPTTTCPTRRPTPRPAPRSAWCSGRIA